MSLVMPWRSVLDNTILGLELHGLTKREARQRAFDLVEIFGLKGFEHQYPHALSGGMRQRAAFLRTMLINQDVILLDEPFGALDAQTRLTVQAEFLRLWEGSKKTVLFVTHDLEEAVLLSDRVLVMTARPGRIKSDTLIDLARPRQIDELKFDKRFNEIEHRIWEQLRDELV